MTSMIQKVCRAAVAASLATIGALAAVSAQAQDLPALPKDIKDKGELRVGVKCDSPPFGMLDPGGKPIGIEVEMAKRIAEYAFGSAAKAQLVCVTSEARIPSLQGNKIDMITFYPLGTFGLPGHRSILALALASNFPLRSGKQAGQTPQGRRTGMCAVSVGAGGALRKFPDGLRTRRPYRRARRWGVFLWLLSLHKQRK